MAKSRFELTVVISDKRKCPKCGEGMTSTGDHCTNFACGSALFPDGDIHERKQCLRNQLAAVTKGCLEQAKIVGRLGEQVDSLVGKVAKQRELMREAARELKGFASDDEDRGRNMDGIHALIKRLEAGDE